MWKVKSKDRISRFDKGRSYEMFVTEVKTSEDDEYRYTFLKQVLCELF
jgi:hypothetical protein